MKHIYMLSEGEYSDYMVGGLYESSVQLSEVKISALVPEMVQEQFPELSADDAYNLSANSRWKLSENLAEHYIGARPDVNYNDKRSVDSWLDWSDKKRKLLEPKDLKLSNFLVRKGILKPIKYEEIHLDEGWI